MVTTFNCVNKWFKINLLSINVDKTHYIQFKTKNKSTLDMNIVCNDNLITSLPKIKFLGIYIYIYIYTHIYIYIYIHIHIHIHDTINWSCHIKYIIPKLSSCHIMSIKPFASPSTLKTIYYSYFNAVISYGLPFWGNSPHAMKIFGMQKK